MATHLKLSGLSLPLIIKKTKQKIEEEEVPIRGVTVVPFHQTVTNRLAWLLHHKQIQITSYPLLKLKLQLRSVKDALAVKEPGAYRVPCECGASYVWVDRSSDER